MMNETTENFEGRNFVNKVSNAERNYLGIVERADGEDGVYDVREITKNLTDIVENTELPAKFEVKDITSSTNKVVQSKMEKITQTEGLDAENVIPKFMVSEYPIAFDEETLKKAPWVNMIHGWMKVLNCLNSISIIQKKDPDELSKSDINTLFSISYDLYRLTLRGPEEFKRRGSDFSVGAKYSETLRRESGELGVNAERKINFLELLYILNVVKKSYSKDREK